MTAETERFMALPEDLGNGAAASLCQSLLVARGGPLVIDGAQVSRVGTLSLQVLMSAAASWQADGQGFRIAGASPSLGMAARTLGLESPWMPLEAVAP